MLIDERIRRYCTVVAEAKALKPDGRSNVGYIATSQLHNPSRTAFRILARSLSSPLRKGEAAVSRSESCLEQGINSS
jgi:hypothetical protein